MLCLPRRPSLVCSVAHKTRAPSRRSDIMLSNFGDAPCAGAAKGTAQHGGTWTSWRIAGSRSPGYPILGRLNASASNTQGGSRMPEFRPCGSVRGGGRSAMSVPTAILIDFARGRPTNPARIPVSPSGRWHQITDPPARPRSAGSRSLKTATARVQPAEARCTFTGKHTMSNPSGGNCARLPSFSI
jgi:hypothetical protein